MAAKNNSGDEIKKMALSRMQQICSRAEKSPKEIETKLLTFQLDDEAILEIIESLKEDNFIDEYRYTEAFIRDKFKFNQWGRLKISNALILKGIHPHIIEEGLRLIEKDEYKLLLIILSEKNKKLTDKNQWQRKGKLFRFAAQKGFANDQIYRAIDDIINE